MRVISTPTQGADILTWRGVDYYFGIGVWRYLEQNNQNIVHAFLLPELVIEGHNDTHN